MTYDAYGDKTGSTGATLTGLGYTGKFTSNSEGLGGFRVGRTVPWGSVSDIYTTYQSTKCD
jgi:hypothetical protein